MKANFKLEEFYLGETLNEVVIKVNRKKFILVYTFDGKLNIKRIQNEKVVYSNEVELKENGLNKYDFVILSKMLRFNDNQQVFKF